MTKNLTIAAIVATFFALPATAGGLAEPVMDPAIIIQDTTSTSSSNSALVPMFLFVLLAGVALN